FGYMVELYENFTYQETKNQLEEIKRDETLCSLLIVVLSHGISRNHFYTSDGKIYDFIKMKRKFTDASCPSLRGKPKILMGSFCRGSDIELVTDEVTQVTKTYEVPHHMVTIYASQEDIKAKRHIQKGTIFISSLCSVLKENPNEKLIDLLDKLAKEMVKRRGTTPQWVTDPPSITNFSFA
ncbi:unnamed protein product, partial [Meganyctiphanes norvegica]